MKIASRINNLGTETAFAVSAQARKWAAKGNKVYPFHLGDINLSTPQNIIEAANRYIVDGKNGYCPSEGILPLREAMADDVGGKRGGTYSPENVSIQPGGKPTIGKFIQAVMNPGDEVLYPNPGYPIYESQIEYHGGTAVSYKYDETDTGFEIDIAKLRSSISDKTVALIYNNYNNPISAESSREEMETIAPPFFSLLIIFAHSCIKKNGALTLVLIILLNNSGDVLKIVPLSVDAALFTKISIFPNFLSIS